MGVIPYRALFDLFIVKLYICGAASAIAWFNSSSAVMQRQQGDTGVAGEIPTT
jgi:hypothetical protein